HSSGYKRSPHVSDLVSDDRASESRQAGSSSRDHSSDRDEGLRLGDGAVENGRGEQDPGLSQRNKVAFSAPYPWRESIIRLLAPLQVFRRYRIQSKRNA